MMDEVVADVVVAVVAALVAILDRISVATERSVVCSDDDGDRCDWVDVLDEEVRVMVGFVAVVMVDDSTLKPFQGCSSTCSFVSKNWRDHYRISGLTAKDQEVAKKIEK